MNKVVAGEGQSLLDVCLQTLGDMGALYDLADANDMAITDPLTPGQAVVVPASVSGRPEVVAFFSARGYRVNTANQPAPTSAPPAPTAPESFFNPDYFTTDHYA
ncbi:hypothetical protein [Hymenobacter glacieicola]|uniref:LysM domain-containing protein n=1 Tax=Hymenobacter glacieicola TaxID=1562124 RepID=A0ABQ1WMH3_9BACT|nr:hypothetical protein [Hymenobacter glacieicola]GGG33444.1 hypothetical protein GCM10011378_07410 [Hymenobacter glacieicola]